MEIRTAVLATIGLILGLAVAGLSLASSAGHADRIQVAGHHPQSGPETVTLQRSELSDNVGGCLPEHE